MESISGFNFLWTGLCKFLATIYFVFFCPEKRKATILDSLDHTNLTIIGVTCGVVLVLLTVSIIIQVKQPRRKYLVRPDEFDPALLPEPLEPPHYELCALRSMASAEDFPELRRSSSKCIRGHHCGSQASNGSRTDLSLGVVAETASNPCRSIVVMKHSHSLEDTEVCEVEDELDNENMEEQSWRSVNIHEHSVHMQWFLTEMIADRSIEDTMIPWKNGDLFTMYVLGVSLKLILKLKYLLSFNVVIINMRKYCEIPNWVLLLGLNRVWCEFICTMYSLSHHLLCSLLVVVKWNRDID